MERARRREQMRRLLERREREGLTYRELARRTGESPRALAWWSGRLRREKGRSSGFVELVARTSGEEGRGGGFEVRLASGRGVVVPPDFEEGALRRLLAVLEARC